MKKRIVSLMFAAMLCVSMPLSVFAADEIETETGSADIDTTGDVKYVNTEVYKVTLPTDGCFNFIVDPQGILSATKPDDYKNFEDGTAGYIIPSEGTGAYINNKSSVPIKLTLDTYVESKDDGTVSTVNLVEDYRDVESGIDNNMWLTLDITNDDLDVTTFIDETSIKTETVEQNVIAITRNGIPGTDEKATQISFALDGAKYAFKDDAGAISYEMVTGEKGDSVGLRMSGLVNTNADWSAYAGTGKEDIIVKTIFKFTKLSTDYDAAALDGRAHGVLEDAEAGYYDGVKEDGTPEDGEMAYTVGWGAFEIEFDFGSGISELGVKSITVDSKDLDPTDYKVINGVITFKSTAANVKAAMDKATADGVEIPVVITTTDDAETSIKVIMDK